MAQDLDVINQMHIEPFYSSVRQVGIAKMMFDNRGSGAGRGEPLSPCYSEARQLQNHGTGRRILSKSDESAP
jgi:hypothetical protein